MEQESNSAKAIARCGINPSHQRIAILSELCSRTDHPSAAMVFDSLAGSMPTLSRTTVYNTLRLFCEKGIAAMVTGEDGEMRFDGRTAFHPHFRCKRCGAVSDIDLDVGIFDGSALREKGFVIEKSHILLTGTCPSCSGRG